jgi:hypothetical protein
MNDWGLCVKVGRERQCGIMVDGMLEGEWRVRNEKEKSESGSGRPGSLGAP